MTLAVSGRENCVAVDGVPYVYVRATAGSFVMRADCPHRGGPLHLATEAPGGKYLICPWHERRASVARLRREIPAVRTGRSVRAVLPHSSNAPVTWQHRPLSRDLAC
ncbi:Rieske 2Fe-2S domain-containing protein [Streptomyces purpurogeneiscleroticus]|uniref:Rieske 2Fe-2S domain-containing protein n=1 Tax=Streptomyces purpurogeneiscleroticus TaxID=68259 RepID=UPI001CBB4EB8|nr:Rieske 2Fe-2S domain-containing protein [Streptomyces purpurogeneiscleroticus]